MIFITITSKLSNPTEFIGIITRRFTFVKKNSKKFHILLIVNFLNISYNTTQGDSMRLLKYLICSILSAVILLTSLPFTAFSEEEKGTIHPFIPDVKEYYSELEDYITEGLRERKSQIDVSDFHIPQDDIIYVFRSVMFDNPDIFYVDSAFIPYDYDRLTDEIAILKPQYIFKKSKIPSYIKEFNKASEKLVDGINPSWSDFKKALIIHDRIAVNCRYYSKGLKSYTAYNVIVAHKGLCEGYSRAYSHLLSLVGVDSKTLNNEAKSHCWNLVKLNGYWYHVDVTADDPTPDVSGYVRHNFFLLTDAGMRAQDSDIHTGYKNDITYSSQYVCNSSKYNGAFFKKITSRIVYKNGAYYYMNNNYKGKYYSALIKRGSSKKVVKVIYDSWRNSSGGRFNKSCCKLFEYGKYIYYNTKRKIIRYNPDTGNFKRIYTLPDFIGTNNIGVTCQGSTVYATRSNANMTKYYRCKTAKFYSKNKMTVLPYLKYSSKQLNKKSSFKLKVYYGSGKTVYKSSNKKIAKVSSSGRVKAKKKGSCTITAEKNGKKLKCKIRVV